MGIHIRPFVQSRAIVNLQQTICIKSVETPLALVDKL